MKRPFWIQPTAWLFAHTRLLALTERQYQQICRQLKVSRLWPLLQQQTRIGRLLYALDGWRHPKIWAGTVVEMPDECAYLVTEEAARKLASRRKIPLLRIYDHSFRLWTPTQIKTALKDGPVFDQLDLTRHDAQAKRTA